MLQERATHGLEVVGVDGRRIGHQQERQTTAVRSAGSHLRSRHPQPVGPDFRAIEREVVRERAQRDAGVRRAELGQHPDAVAGDTRERAGLLQLGQGQALELGLGFEACPARASSAMACNESSAVAVAHWLPSSRSMERVSAAASSVAHERATAAGGVGSEPVAALGREAAHSAHSRPSRGIGDSPMAGRRHRLTAATKSRPVGRPRSDTHRTPRGWWQWPRRYPVATSSAPATTSPG